MPEMWIDVDTAVTVPVNVMPLVSDSDFKTIQPSVAYNAAGLVLVWNFQTAAGVTSQTAVTPTTSGVYDWTATGNGMFKIEIPASGGGSINNDTEGTGHFTGVATGVAPWRGPYIGIRAAGLNDKLIESPYSAALGLAGTATVSLAVTTGAVTTDGGNSATSFETDLAQTTNDYWKDAYLVLTSGVLSGQVKRVTGYNGTTKIITVSGGFTGTPADGVTFAIVNR
jgi:hypothetical protein